MLKIGDYVTRKKYGNDIIFVVDKIENDIIYLKGLDVRLYADAYESDLIKAGISKKKKQFELIRNINKEKFFFIPGVILHIDSDESYMNRCLEYYKSQNLKAYGFLSKESDFEKKIISLIDKYNPSIVVLTGHDAYYAKSKDGNSYKNSNYFINTVKKIKKTYGDRIIIFAGACQSNFEGIIKAGASFASSPKRVNIHALDPAIVASYIALTDVNEIIHIMVLRV